MKKKILIVAILFSACLSANAFIGYYKTTCGEGGGAMYVDPTWSGERLLRALIELNEEYCGKGSGAASYSSNPFPQPPQTETPENSTDETDKN